MAAGRNGGSILKICLRSRARSRPARIWLSVFAIFAVLFAAGAGLRCVYAQAAQTAQQPSGQPDSQQAGQNAQPASQDAQPAGENAQSAGQDAPPADLDEHGADEPNSQSYAVDGKPPGSQPDPEPAAKPKPAEDSQPASGAESRSDAASDTPAAPVAAAPAADLPQPPAVVPPQPAAAAAVPPAVEIPAAVLPTDPRQRQVALECADLLRMAAALKTAVDKSTKDELSVDVVRKAGEIEQYARKVHDGTPMTAGKE